jgi:hypothetical protein
MTRELKVYNQFDELILHLEFVSDHPLPLQIVDGTPELRSAVRSLLGRDFDRTVVVGSQQRRFAAKWGSPDYVDALAGYWSSNFGWRTRIVDQSVSLTLPVHPNATTMSVILNTSTSVRRIVTSGPNDVYIASALLVGPGASLTVFSVTNVQRPSLGVKTTTYASGLPLVQPVVITRSTSNDPAQRPSPNQIPAAV